MAVLARRSRRRGGQLAEEMRERDRRLRRERFSLVCDASADRNRGGAPDLHVAAQSVEGAMARVALTGPLRFDAEGSRGGDGHACEERRLEPGAIARGSERKIRIGIADVPQERVCAEAPGDVAVTERRGAAEAALAPARRERNIDLAERQPGGECRATAEQTAASLDPASEREMVGPPAAVMAGESEARVIEASGPEVLAPQAHLRRVVRQPRSENA